MNYSEEIKEYYDKNDEDEVFSILSEYCGPDKDSVLAGILKLSQGSIEGVKYHTKIAQTDYRDILYWIELENEDRLKAKIDGMTVNERLYHLNLFNKYDIAIAEKDEEKLREILVKCHLDEKNISAIVTAKISPEKIVSCQNPIQQKS